MQTVAHTSVDDMVTLVVGGRDSCQKSNRGRTLKRGGNGMLRYLFNCFLHQFSKSIGHLFFTRSYLLTNLVGSSARNSGLLQLQILSNYQHPSLTDSRQNIAIFATFSLIEFCTQNNKNKNGKRKHFSHLPSLGKRSGK